MGFLTQRFPDRISAGGQATVQRQPMGSMSSGNIYVTNNAPAEVKEAKRDDRGDWHLLIEAAADQAHSRVAADVGSGSGRVATATKGRGCRQTGEVRVAMLLHEAATYIANKSDRLPIAKAADKTPFWQKAGPTAEHTVCRPLTTMTPWRKRSWLIQL